MAPKTQARSAAGAATRERANFWGLGLRSAQMLLKARVDLSDPAAVERWFTALASRAQMSLTAKFRARISEERAKLAKTPGAEPGPDPDVVEFERTYKPAPGGGDNLAWLRQELAFYLFQLRRARLRKDKATESEAARQVRNFSEMLHDCELRAKKLGRDLGESFSGDDVDRLGRALGFHMMHSADAMINAIAGLLVVASATGPLDREKIRRAIEPIVTAERVLAPLARATKINAGVALPARLVAAVRLGVDGVLEDGAAEFDKCAASPP